MKLILSRPELYRVKHGQTLTDTAACFRVPLPLLCRSNNLSAEPEEGEILRLPPAGGDLYRVQGGESRTLLCGSEESFFARNGTRALYPSQRVYL